MKMNRILQYAMLTAGILCSGAALADRGHGHGGGHRYGGHGGHWHGNFGLYLGAPYPYDLYPYYSYRYPYYPPVVTVPVPTEPPVYIEQDDEQVDQSQAQEEDDYYWYHCNKPKGYYPYIKKCPGGWEKVTPTPPPNE